MKIGKKPLGHAVWFKLVLTLLVFIPAYSGVPYEPRNATSVIASVLAHPMIVSAPWLLPLSKLLLLFVVIAPFALGEKSGRVVVGYYAFVLVVVGIFQNIAHTETYGFVWLLGNTLLEFVVLGFCIYDFAKGKTKIQRRDFNRGRSWIIPLMLLAYLMPYAVSDTGAVIPGFFPTVFHNEAGVTYCMITPVILGVMLLFSKGVHKPTLSIVAYVGFVFGLLNTITWFGMQRESWWMGILHLPLVIIALCGLIVGRQENAN